MQKYLNLLLLWAYQGKITCEPMVGHLADETSYRNGRRRGADARVLHVENADN